MKIEGGFTAMDWSRVPFSEHAGERSGAAWRTWERGDLRVRVVDYHAGYLGDHWCERGHVFFVIDGEVTVELADGRSHALGSGQGFQAGADSPAHRCRSERGARVFIVD